MRLLKKYLAGIKFYQAAIPFKQRVLIRIQSLILVLLIIVPIICIISVFYVYPALYYLLSFAILILIICALFGWNLFTYKCYEDAYPFVKGAQKYTIILTEGIVLGVLMILIGTIIILNILSRM